MYGLMRVGDTHVAMGHVSVSPRTVVKNLWDMCIHARNLSKSCETERLTQPNLKRQVVYLEPQQVSGRKLYHAYLLSIGSRH
jgi:hypothetical protein